MREAIRQAMLIDSNANRGREVEVELLRANVAVTWRLDAVNQSGAGCDVDNLFAAGGALPNFDVLFIHLGPLQKHQRAGRISGNECSMEFLLHHLPMLEQRCVVAYTGGPTKPPNEFVKSCDPKWHAFFPRVLRAIALEIRPFIEIWRHAPGEPPPLLSLTHGFEPVNTFRALVSDYRKAHAGGSKTGCEEREVPERWQSVFAKDSAADGLIKRLEWAGDEAGCRVASALKAWLDARSGGGFDSPLREAIVRTRAWVASPESAPR